MTFSGSLTGPWLNLGISKSISLPWNNKWSFEPVVSLELNPRRGKIVDARRGDEILTLEETLADRPRVRGV
jgi:hypothetical protein